jgi:DNA modification methylase
MVSNVKKVPWKAGEYKKQNWGIWLHSISSYVGRIKPAFAHCLIELCSNKDDVIFDPFCGIGTVILEADLMGRKAIGNDLNPYAYLISKAKLDRRGLDKEIKYLQRIKLRTDQIDLNIVPEWVREYYDDNTLKEILALSTKLIKHKREFLLGCLLGIIHGHRKQHLSIRTGYIIPYIPNPKPPKEYKEVIPKMIEKVKRMYKDPFPIKHKASILNQDTRNLQLKSKSIDVIISSPPYYNTIDYVHVNRLRLWFAGVCCKKQDELSSTLIQQKHTYLNQMEDVGIELKRILKDDGLIVFVLGDVNYGTKSVKTAEDIREIYKKIGFSSHGIVCDEIPAARTTIVKYGGNTAINNKKTKLDRILFLTKK